MCASKDRSVRKRVRQPASHSQRSIYADCAATSVRPCHQIDCTGNDEMAGRQRQIYDEERFA